MFSFFSSVVLLLGVAIIILLIWNIVLFKSRKSKRKNSEEYIEIKYQQQFYLAIFATLIGLISFIGYDKYSDLQDNITKEIEQKTSVKAEKYNHQMDSMVFLLQSGQREITLENKILKESNQHLNSQTDKANEILYKMLYDFANVKNELYNSERSVQNQIERVKRFNNDIEELRKNDFLNQVHLVTGLKFNEEKNIHYIDTVYFERLRTIGGNTLPLFNHPPSIILSKASIIEISISTITNKYFIIEGGFGISGVVDEHGNTIKDLNDVVYDLLIIYRDSEN